MAKKETLKEKLISSKVIKADEIETSEEIKQMIEDVNEDAINKFIVDKIVSSAKEPVMRKPDKQTDKQAVVAQIAVDINEPDGQAVENEKISHKEFIKAFIRR